MEQENAQQPSGPPRMRKRVAAAILVVLMIIGGGLAYYYWHRSQIYISTDDAYVTGHIHVIAPRVPGTILEVNVDDNQLVDEGYLLVKLDPATYEAAVRDADAALELAKTTVAQMEAAVKVARANLANAEANQKLAEADFRRTEDLYKVGVDSKEQFDQALTRLNVTVAGVGAAAEQLKQALAALGSVPEGGVHPLILQRQAQLEQARLNLSYTSVPSPVKGHVTQKNAEIGNQVQAGQPLMSIVPLADVWIEANYKETQLKRVQPGQPVVIDVDTYPGHEFKGKVDSIMAGTGAVFSLFPPENATGNFVKVVQRIPVKIVLDSDADPDHVLRVGMSVQPVIDTTAR